MNGVPLRRVNQRYAIATSTKVPLTGVDVSAVDDAFFAREKVDKKNKPVFTAESPKNEICPARKSAQAAVDAALTKSIAAVDKLTGYIQAKFSLSRADKPHAMKF